MAKKCKLNCLKKKYQEKWENAYLTVKNARASRVLRQALDPSWYWLALLAPLRFTSLAKFLGPPLLTKSWIHYWDHHGGFVKCVANKIQNLEWKCFYWNSGWGGINCNLKVEWTRILLHSISGLEECKLNSKIWSQIRILLLLNF